MRIVRGTRRGGSLDIPVAVAMGMTVAVPLAGAVGVPLTGGLTVVVPLAGALIGQRPVPGPGLRSGLPGLRPGGRRGSPG
ncbi:hypothetical protein ACFZDK_32065 [Streptomyces sp. NPDC007901]|uniref:hypothetical protein n=1 Tax=Streptomyces sp. NPDC007901 TaxID=3364785 RepID=UPI0036EC5498